MRGSYLYSILILLVAIEAFDSYKQGMFWPAQVIAKWNRKGISFFAHAGMWSDLIILPFLFAYIVNAFGGEWTKDQMLLMGAVGTVIAGGNHLLLMFTQGVPDPIGWKKEWFSVTIVLHFFYMALLVAIVGLFYFYSVAGITAVVLVSLALGIHMTAGMHVFTGVLQRFVNLPNCPDFLANPQPLYMSAAVWIALAMLATHAAGLRAGLMVALAFVILATGFFFLSMIEDSRS
jgi:hypothetical protein